LPKESSRYKITRHNPQYLLRADIEVRVADGVSGNEIGLADFIQKFRDFLIKLVMARLDASRVANRPNPDFLPEPWHHSNAVSVWQ